MPFDSSDPETLISEGGAGGAGGEVGSALILRQRESGLLLHAHLRVSPSLAVKLCKYLHAGLDTVRVPEPVFVGASAALSSRLERGENLSRKYLLTHYEA